MLTTNAVVLRERGRAPELEEVRLHPPGPTDVVVRITASGVCHSDLSMRDGVIPLGLPAVMGHEGAGVVEDVGRDVDGVAVGDRVVVDWLAQCGRCYYCDRGMAQLCDAPGSTLPGVGADGVARRRDTGGNEVFAAGAIGTFAQLTVAPREAVIPVKTTLSDAELGILGCAVITGVGAAVNTAHVRADDVAVVLGCGGIGMNVVQGCAWAGARAIVAVDRDVAKLDIARRLGATHTCASIGTDLDELVGSLTAGRGADVSFEAVGAPPTAQAAVRVIRPAGTAVLIGIPGPEVATPLSLFGVVSRERRIVGSRHGSAATAEEVPRLVAAAEAGQLDLGALISRTVPLAEAAAALDGFDRPGELRTVVVP